jgi:hypothetical protein
MSSPPPPLQLCGLPAELVAAILLRLSALQRVRVERACRGWLAFLRSREGALWAACELDTAATRRELRAAGLDADAALRALLARAGGALRSVRCADVRSHRAAEALVDALAARPLAPHVQALRFPRLLAAAADRDHAVFAVHDLARRAAASLPALRELDLGSMEIRGPRRNHAYEYGGGGADDEQALRALLAEHLPCGAVTLTLRRSLLLVPHREAQNFLVHIQTTAKLVSLSDRLRACDWRAVTLRVPRLYAPRATLAQRERALAEAVPRLTLLCRRRAAVGGSARRLSLAPPLPAQHAASLARDAAPQGVRTAAWRVLARPEDAPLLGAALQPGFAVVATLVLRGAPSAWAGAPLDAALAALDAAAAAACAQGDTPRLGLELSPAGDDDDADADDADAAAELWSELEAAPVLRWLRDNAAVVALTLAATPAAAAAALGALPPALRELDVSRCCCGAAEADAALPALLPLLARMARMARSGGALASLATLRVGALSWRGARELAAALSALPPATRATTTVHYTILPHTPGHTLDPGAEARCHAAMAAALLRCCCANGSGAVAGFAFDDDDYEEEAAEEAEEEGADAMAALLACLRAEATRHARDGAVTRAAALPQLLAAMHAAAAALARGNAPCVDVTALLRLLTWLELGDADAVDDPGFDDASDDDDVADDGDAAPIRKGLVTRDADAALVRSLTALLCARRMRARRSRRRCCTARYARSPPPPRRMRTRRCLWRRCETSLPPQPQRCAAALSRATGARRTRA